MRFDRDRFLRKTDYIYSQYGWAFYLDWWIKVISKMTDDEFSSMFTTDNTREYHIEQTRQLLVRSIDNSIGVNK